MKTDLQIAQETPLLPITQVAAQIGLSPDDLLLYGPNKAKITEQAYARVTAGKKGKLVLVTAINPTPMGEGKTTTTIGIGQGMPRLGKKAMIALREPSMGPVFGVKGGAAGGGYAQVIPMEDINLHFTGDMHAITAANNLLCAMIDNSLQQGNPTNLDARTVTFRRCMDMNDRALRFVHVGLGGKANGVPREDGFCITVASEIMAILCLAADLADLKARLGRILVGYTFENKPVFAADLKAEGAMCALLKDALQPNLVQTLEHTPCVMHGGPFANIAHGCNSVRATRFALSCADYCITEAGFGSDLGAEKFLDIKCQLAGLAPDCIVLVATARALKYNGGVPKGEVAKENLEALKAGLCNLQAHVQNMQQFGVPVVVAINRFGNDSLAELDCIAVACKQMGAKFALSEGFAKGGEGTVALCQAICDACEEPSQFTPVYDPAASIEDKILAVAQKVYGADGVTYSAKAQKDMENAKRLGFDKTPVCIAKTQYSLSDNPKLLGRPGGFMLQVRSVNISAGAGFLVVIAGDIMTMPGLPPVPAAQAIDVDANGMITGLF